MTAMVDIRAALETHLLSLEPSWETYFANLILKPDTVREYQRVDLLHAEPVSYVGTGAAIKYQGVFYIIVVTHSGVGSGAATTRADALLTHFSKGQSFTKGVATVRTNSPYLGRAAQDDQEYSLPVLVPWFCHIF
jgi:hypothetical protein